GIVGLSMRYVGKREVIVGNLAKANATTLEYMKPFMTFRLYGDYLLLTRDNFSVKLKAGVDNLFNTEYEEYPGIPMPGVTGTTSIEFSF
ncbi:MAG: hypothetical protein N2053_01520, partial [Chitinispirillaceae bacterium]|nr:hypothetical protein [Chitinispirillaceae bacterium]